MPHCGNLRVEVVALLLACGGAALLCWTTGSTNGLARLAVRRLRTQSLVGQGQRASQCPDWTVPWPSEACQANSVASNAAEEFLRKNMFPWDAPNEATLFDGGIIGPTVNLSLTARQRFGWAARVPRDIWQDAVLPYASVNEARTDWRQLLWTELTPLVATLSNASTLEDVATFVNQHMWTTLGKFSGSKSIVFKSEQTPLIYDPMSTMLYGYASCTGVSILFVDALRTLGVPARVVGTPAWHGKQADGNHNWVEVWLGDRSNSTDTGDEWAFLEAAPAGGGETFTNPCDKWFCNKAHFLPAPNTTRVYSTAFDRSGDKVSYPMAWDLSNTQVKGVDRTEIYNSVCSKCGALTVQS